MPRLSDDASLILFVIWLLIAALIAGVAWLWFAAKAGGAW